MIEKAIAALNEAFKSDPGAMHALMCNRVPCNKALADHPTVQVESLSVIGGDMYAVGALGLINGVIEPLTGKRVAVLWSDEADVEGRKKILGFCEYKNPTPSEQ